MKSPAAAADAPVQPLPPAFEQLYRQAQEHLQSEDFEAAGQGFAAALELEPRHAGALCNYALCLRNQSEFEQAQHILNRALFLYPSDLNLLNEQGQLDLDQSHYPDALKIFDRMLSIDPGSELAVHRKAETLRQMGNFEEAGKVIEAAIAKFPASTAMLKERGWLYFDQKLWDQAAEAFLQSCQNNPASFVQLIKSFGPGKVDFLEAAHRSLPGNVEIMVRLGRAYSHKKQFEPALAVLEEARARHSTNEDATLARISVLRKLKRFEDASAAIKEVPAELSKSLPFLRERAMLYVDQELWDQAVEVCVDAKAETTLGALLNGRPPFPRNVPEKLIKAAVARLPKDVTVLNRLGQFYFDQEQYDQAIGVFEEVLKLDPGNEEALAQRITGRAWVAYRQKQYDAAVAAFVEAKNEDALRSEISSLQEKRHFKDCEQLIDAALKQMPRDVQILNLRGGLLIDQRRYREAEKAFQQAVEYAQQDSETPDEVIENALARYCESLRSQRRFADAEAAIGQALNQRPKSDAVLSERGWLYYDQALYDEAVEAFETVIKLNAESPNEWAIQGKIESLCSKRDFSAAEKFAEEELLILPDNATIYYELGKVYYEWNKVDKADEFYRKALVESPDYLDASLDRADLLQALNRSNEGLKVLQDLKDSHPDDLQVRERLGFFYLRLNEFRKAREEFQSIRDLDPTSTYGINGMGALYFNESQYREAEDLFRKALEQETSADFHNNLAWALVRQAKLVTRAPGPSSPKWFSGLPEAIPEKKPESGKGQLDEAEEHSRAALQFDPNYADACSCLGVIAFKRGHLLEAEEYFQKSIQLDERQAESYADLGALYSQMGRYDDAVTTLNKARELDRANVQSRLELGNVYLQTDRLKDAIRMFHEAMAANPNDEGAPRALAIALIRAEDFVEAGRVLRKAIRTFDQFKTWRLRLTLCQLLTRLADKNDDKDLYEEALKESSQAIALKPDDPSPYFHAGIVYYKLEEYVRARKNFRECLKKDPDYFEAEQNIRRLQALIWRDRSRTRGGLYLGVALGILCLGLLITIWVLYFQTSKITQTMLSTISPILLGLVFVAFLLPWLSRLKLPGFEADLIQHEEKISSGPQGSVEFDTLSVGTGPQ